MTSIECYPAHGTADGTWHVLIWNGAPYPARWRAGMWRIGYVTWDPRWPVSFSVVYVRPLDLDAAPMTTGVTAVLNKASAWRDAAYALADGNHSIGIGDLSRELLDAIDIVRPYTPPDPVAAALAKLRATTGDEDKYTAAAARAYLDALDAKEAL